MERGLVRFQNNMEGRKTSYLCLQLYIETLATTDGGEVDMTESADGM